MRDCPFVPYGPPRLVPRQQRLVVNLVSAGGVGKSPSFQYGGSPGSTASHAASGPRRIGEPRLARDEDLRPDPASTREVSRDASGGTEKSSVERARNPDRATRPPRPRPVSPDRDKTSALAAESVKSYQIMEDGNFIPRLLSTASMPERDRYRLSIY